MLSSCSGRAEAPATPAGDDSVAVESDSAVAAQPQDQPVDTSAFSDYGLRTGGVNVLTNDSIFRADSKVNMLTVLDFNAVWCGPCRTFAPIFDAAAEKYRSVMFVSVDIDRMPLTTHAFGIRAVPTLIFIRPDGKITTYTGLNEIYPAAAFDSVIAEQMKM